jgi:hypothetical protein
MNHGPRYIALLLFGICALSACTWVAPDARGERVEVAYFGVPAHCEERGKITVSVAHRVAGVRRSEIKVKDELESLARNTAPAGSDTVVPLGEPVDGQQEFQAYRCR